MKDPVEEQRVEPSCHPPVQDRPLLVPHLETLHLPRLTTQATLWSFSTPFLALQSITPNKAVSTRGQAGAKSYCFQKVTPNTEDVYFSREP